MTSRKKYIRQPWRYREEKQNTPKNRKKLIISLLLIVLVLTGVIFLRSGKSEQEKEAKSETKITLTPKQSSIEADKTKTVIPINLSMSNQPTILIYHTHTLEAYLPTEKYPYTERGGKWRTNDNTRNVVTVGNVLESELKSYGFNVIHDITNHEPPKLATAYSRSLKTMQAYKEKYPSLLMFIDLHRDASNTRSDNDYCIVDGEKAARIMFVVGTGKGATGTGFPEMPDFESNYALACSLTEYLRDINPNLVREVRVKTGRYNQHISNHCMLAEMGHNMNTLEEALVSAKLLAKAIAHECGVIK